MKYLDIKNIILTLLFILSVVCLSSCNTANLSDARLQYVRGEYYAASETYRKVYRNLKPNERAMRGVVAYEMAESYKKLNYPIRASSGYANAIRYNYPDTLMYLSYAQMLHKEGNYAKAVSAYQDYILMDSANYMAQVGLMGANNAANNIHKPFKHIVKRMDIFNSNRSEFAPMFANNDNVIYITSSRNDAKGDSVSDITGLKNNDIFIITKNDKGEWNAPHILESEINTTLDEGVTSVSSDGTYLYYTYSPQSSQQVTATKIYYSRRSGGGGWSAGRELIVSRRDSTSIFAHPAISPDNNWLYFVSDMPGGYGGKDIWKAYISDNLVLSIENLGPEINTPGDEMFPYLKNDTVLYFSSDGHPGYGGLDLFEAKFDKRAGTWSVHNMGIPINSSMDDFGITFEKEKYKGFLSSNRNDARGRDHIYSFELPETKIFVEGFVVNHEDDYLLNAHVNVIGDDGTKREFITKKDGIYKFEAIAGAKYIMQSSAEGYLNSKKDVMILPADKDTTYYVDFEMTPYEKPVVLENIFYDFDKSTLRPESKQDLDELIALLGNNPNIAIELSAHTDRKGTDSYNNDLSLRRAQSVVAYLMLNGIEKDRLTAVGYGKTVPKEVTKTLANKYDFLEAGIILSEEYIETLTEEQQQIADQINRRTEFKVIDLNYGLY